MIRTTYMISKGLVTLILLIGLLFSFTALAAKPIKSTSLCPKGTKIVNDFFTYTISDGQGGTDTANVVVELCCTLELTAAVYEDGTVDYRDGRDISGEFVVPECSEKGKGKNNKK